MTTETLIPTAGRPEPEGVRAMFGRLAARYDRANSVLSMGMHYRWRARAVGEVAAKLAGRPKAKVLDAATGTGDFAFALAKRLGAEVAITASDFCEPMLDVAREKWMRRGGTIRFEAADLTALPYADGAFDAATVGFGVRNVGDLPKALKELRRVLAPGGRLVILEFGEGQGRGIERGFRAFLKVWLPFAGGRVTGDGEAYAYLDRSSQAFPAGDAFLAKLREAGFSAPRFETLSFGSVFLYVADV